MRKYLFTLANGNEYMLEAFSESGAKAVLIAHFKQQIKEIINMAPETLKPVLRNYVFEGYDANDVMHGMFTYSAHSRDEALDSIQKIIISLGLTSIVRFELKEAPRTDQSIIEYAPGCFTRV